MGHGGAPGGRVMSGRTGGWPGRAGGRAAGGGRFRPPALRPAGGPALSSCSYPSAPQHLPQSLLDEANGVEIISQALVIFLEANVPKCLVSGCFF